MLIERGDGVVSIKRCRHDLRSDDVSTLVMPSENGRPKGTLEDLVYGLQPVCATHVSRAFVGHLQFCRTCLVLIKVSAELLDSNYIVNISSEKANFVAHLRYLLQCS
ncbi:hypothetical protein Tco_0607874 [Tanacetum coccineum]